MFQSRKMVNNTTTSTCGLVARWVYIITLFAQLVSCCCGEMCTYSLLLVSLSGPGLTSLLLTLALLQESLGNENVILLGDLAVGMSETSVVRRF